MWWKQIGHWGTAVGCGAPTKEALNKPQLVAEMAERIAVPAEIMAAFPVVDAVGDMVVFSQVVDAVATSAGDVMAVWDRQTHAGPSASGSDWPTM